MADTTRCRVSNNISFYHRMDASGDAPQHDVATTEAAAAGIGCSADYEFDGDSSITAVASGFVADGTSSAGTGSTDSTGNYVKHSGYTSSDKDVATAADTVVYIHTVAGNTTANYFHKLHPGQGIWLQGGTSFDRISNFFFETSTGDVYMETWTVDD